MAPWIGFRDWVNVSAVPHFTVALLLQVLSLTAQGRDVMNQKSIREKKNGRGCDRFGCGAFNSKRAVDVVCDDYSVVNAPFSGTLGGPVYRKVADGIRDDGVKLLSSEYCVKIFNVRPYRYMGPISKGEAMGYLLPLQERFSGITSHLELQMCDRSNPFPYI
uniref:Si:ch1073-204b8.1 n=1 Tax=Scleropages formosus TaxID=113540 RepID=A0A8C9T6S2_SCLFO